MASNFFNAFRRASRTVDSATETASLITAIRNASTFDSSLSSILNASTFDINPNTRVLRMNDALDLNVADDLLRRGNLRRFATLSKNTDPGSRAQAGFRQSINGTTPELKIRELEDAITSARIAHSDLDITPNVNDTNTDFLQRMTPSARQKLDGIMGKIKSIAGASAVVGGVIVGFILTADILRNLIDETLNRRGCFRIRPTGRGNDIVSCRLLSRTCQPPLEERSCVGGDFPFPNPSEFFPTNVRLVLEQALTDTEMQARIKYALALTVDTTYDHTLISSIMGNASQFRIVADLHLNDKFKVIDPCMNVGGGGVNNDVLCRACNNGLAPTNAEFVDLSELEDPSISLICITSSSLLDTIVDIGIGTGVDLLSPFGRISDSGSGAMILYMLIVVLLIIVAAVIFTIIKKKN